MPQVRFATPDSVLDGLRYPGVVARAASLRGDDHRHSGDTRQDSIGLWALTPPQGPGGHPVLLGCVADGVGSQALSHVGSAAACRLLHERVTASLDELTGRANPARRCRRILAEVAEGLTAAAARDELDPKMLSTTLVAALIVPRQQESGPAADLILFGVGDSRAFVLREGRWSQIPDAAAADQGVISTGTDALPSRPDAAVVTVQNLYEEDMLMICSDGLSTPLLLNVTVQDQLAAWWTGRVPSLPEFYWQMSFRAQTYGDDRSAVCFWLNAAR